MYSVIVFSQVGRNKNEMCYVIISYSKRSPRALQKADAHKSPRQTAYTANVKRGKLNENDVIRINDMINGWKKDKEPLVQFLTRKTNYERQQLKVQYEERYKRVRNSIDVYLFLRF